MAGELLNFQNLTFVFDESAQSQREAKIALTMPAGTSTTLLAIQSFDYAYADEKQYGFGRFSLAVRTQNDGTVTNAVCSVALRDNHTDERQWEGRVTVTAYFFGTP
jgi:hypothetical protein